MPKAALDPRCKRCYLDKCTSGKTLCCVCKGDILAKRHKNAKEDCRDVAAVPASARAFLNTPRSLCVPSLHNEERVFSICVEDSAINFIIASSEHIYRGKHFILDYTCKACV